MNKATKFSNYFKLPNPGLRAYFSSVERGNPDEYRTPFYKGKSLDQILKPWVKELASLKREWPTLYDFEIDLSKKVGPMSIRKPLSERLEDIDHYYEDILLPRVNVDDAAVDALRREWSKAAGLRIKSQLNTVESMKKSTNSGSPFFTKRRLCVNDTIPCTVTSESGSVYQELGPDCETWNACAILGWRGQEGGPTVDDVKQRVVWMFPFAVNIEELRVYQPLIQAFQRLNLVPAWVGMDAVDKRVTQLFDTKKPSDLIVCTDFSKFDQHFNRSLQRVAEEMLVYLFGGSTEINAWIDEIFPIKYTIPLAYNWDKIRIGEHGMGSGSGGTNADETLAHRALQHEAALKSHTHLNPNSQCLGDDGILSYPGITVEDVIGAYKSHGLEMNSSKQYASKLDCTYLRRWHHTDYRKNDVCVGVYSTCRALGRLAEQERFYDPEDWGAKMVALRELSIIENVKWHPLREKFADYCMAGDKYRLGLDIPGFLSNIEKYAKAAIDLMPDFLGYTKSLQYEVGDPNSGISTWWIVNYLKSKA